MVHPWETNSMKYPLIYTLKTHIQVEAIRLYFLFFGSNKLCTSGMEKKETRLDKHPLGRILPMGHY